MLSLGLHFKNQLGIQWQENILHSCLVPFPHQLLILIFISIFILFILTFEWVTTCHLCTKWVMVWESLRQNVGSTFWPPTRILPSAMAWTCTTNQKPTQPQSAILPSCHSATLPVLLFHHYAILPPCHSAILPVSIFKFPRFATFLRWDPSDGTSEPLLTLSSLTETWFVYCV